MSITTRGLGSTQLVTRGYGRGIVPRTVEFVRRQLRHGRSRTGKWWNDYTVSAKLVSVNEQALDVLVEGTDSRRVEMNGDPRMAVRVGARSLGSMVRKTVGEIVTVVAKIISPVRKKSNGDD